MPEGQVAALQPSLLERFASLAASSAEALTAANVRPVGAGVRVGLGLQRNTGELTDTGVFGVTDENGRYSLGIPGNADPASVCRFVVYVGDFHSGTITRAFITTTREDTDIDLNSEAVVRLVMERVEQGGDLCTLQARELRGLVAYVQSLPASIAGTNASDVNRRAAAAAGADDYLQRTLDRYFAPTATPVRTPRETFTSPPTGSPTPRNTPAHTNTAVAFTPTPAPSTCELPARPAPAGPALYVDDLCLQEFGAATITVRLATGGQSVAGTQNDLVFAPFISINTNAKGKPDCAVNPEIDKGSTSFAFIPANCAPGTCTGVRAIVLSMENTNPIPDGAALFTCNAVVFAPDVLGNERAILSDPSGGRIDGATGRDGRFQIAGMPNPTPTTQPDTPTPVETATPELPTATPTGEAVTPVATNTSGGETATPTPAMTSTEGSATATATATATSGGSEATVTPTISSNAVSRKCTLRAGAAYSVVKLNTTLGLNLNVSLSGYQSWVINPPDATGRRYIQIPASESHFGSAVLLGMVKVCPRPGGDGYGLIDCAGGTPEYDISAEQDHDAARPPNVPGIPDDPNCTASYLNPGDLMAHASRESDSDLHPGVCNGPLRVIQHGNFAKGGMTLTETLIVRLLTDVNEECPKDDVPFDAELDSITISGVVTTGKAEGRVYNAMKSADPWDLTDGVLETVQEGSVFGCENIDQGILNTGKLGLSIPVIDLSLATVGNSDIVASLQLACR